MSLVGENIRNRVTAGTLFPGGGMVGGQRFQGPPVIHPAAFGRQMVILFQCLPLSADGLLNASLQVQVNGAWETVQIPGTSEDLSVQVAGGSAVVPPFGVPLADIVFGSFSIERVPSSAPWDALRLELDCVAGTCAVAASYLLVAAEEFAVSRNPNDPFAVLERPR